MQTGIHDDDKDADADVSNFMMRLTNLPTRMMTTTSKRAMMTAEWVLPQMAHLWVRGEAKGSADGGVFSNMQEEIN